MNYKSIPHALNAEILLAYLGEERCKVKFRGHHKRMAYNDLLEMEESWDGEKAEITLSRNSIYNILPESMFHPLDRFSNIPEKDAKVKMEEEFMRQDEEKDNAYRFFAPIDMLLFQERIALRDKLTAYTERNKVLEDLICDRMDEEQKRNPFIQEILPFISYSKYIRGDRTLLGMMLQKVLTDEGLKVEVREKLQELTDPEPAYLCAVDDSLNALYAGNVYEENVTTYEIHYWPDNQCDEHFLDFIKQLDVLRCFVSDWMLSVEEQLVFDVSNSIDTVRLSDDTLYNYLDYNTNL